MERAKTSVRSASSTPVPVGSRSAAPVRPGSVAERFPSVTTDAQGARVKEFITGIANLLLESWEAEFRATHLREGHIE